MTSYSFANVLGWIVLVVVLAAAVFYGPLGQFGRHHGDETSHRPTPFGDGEAFAGFHAREHPGGVLVERAHGNLGHGLIVLPV